MVFFCDRGCSALLLGYNKDIIRSNLQISPQVLTIPCMDGLVILHLLLLYTLMINSNFVLSGSCGRN